MKVSLTPARGLVFVRAVKTAETLAGGRILLTQNVREQWTGQQAEIVAVGAPAMCEDEDCDRPHMRDFEDGIERERMHITHLKAGDWVLVTARSYIEVTPDVWAVPQDHVLAVIEEGA